MADEVYHERSNNWVGWLALILSIIALTIAWMAYNRAGEDLENQAGDAIDNTTQEIQQGADEAGDAAQDAADNTEEAVDEGPDGVDDGTQ